MADQLVADWWPALWPGLINHLWQATLTALLAWGATWLLRRGPARARHLIWLLALAKFLVPSALVAALARGSGLALALPWPGPISLPANIDFVLQVAQPVTASAGPNVVTSTFALVWAAGALALGARWLGRRRQFVRALDAGSKVGDGRLAAALGRARLSLLLPDRAGLVTSPAIAEPGLWGIRRPVVVLPEGLAERLSDDELEAVLLHELIHLRRRDNLLGTWQMIVCCLFWFHPVVWLIDRQLLAERELACDEEVVRLGGSPRLYALSLWKVVRFGLGWPVAGVSRAAGANLRRRIEHMLHDKYVMRPTPSQRLIAGAAVLLLVAPSFAAGLSAGGGARVQKAITPGDLSGGVLRGIPGGVSAGVPGGVSAGVPGGVSAGVPGGVARRQDEDHIRPKILYRPQASYTEEAKQNRVEGDVELSLVFRKDGKIDGIRVVRGLPDGLTEQSIEAAQGIEFEPALKDGQPVSVRANIVIRFRLE